MTPLGNVPHPVPFKCPVADCTEPDVAYYISDDRRVIEHPSSGAWSDESHWSTGEPRMPNNHLCWYGADLVLRPGWDVPPDFMEELPL